MNITPITRDNLNWFQGFLSEEDAAFIREDLRILPLGLVADDLEGRKNLAAGALCIRPEEASLRISSFYVSPEYRERGGGSFLLEKAKELFLEEDTILEAEFLLYGREEEGLKDFLEKKGFASAEPEKQIYLVTLGELIATGLGDKKGDGVFFSELSEETLAECERRSESQWILLPRHGLLSEKIDRDISSAILSGNRIDSFAVVEKVSRGILLLSSVYVKDSVPTVFLRLLEKTVSGAASKYPAKTRVLIQTVDETGESILDRILTEPRMISCRYQFML